MHMLSVNDCFALKCFLSFARLTRFVYTKWELFFVNTATSAGLSSLTPSCRQESYFSTGTGARYTTTTVNKIPCIRRGRELERNHYSRGRHNAGRSCKNADRVRGGFNAGLVCCYRQCLGREPHRSDSRQHCDGVAKSCPASANQCVLTLSSNLSFFSLQFLQRDRYMFLFNSVAGIL